MALDDLDAAGEGRRHPCQRWPSSPPIAAEHLNAHEDEDAIPVSFTLLVTPDASPVTWTRPAGTRTTPKGSSPPPLVTLAEFAPLVGVLAAGDLDAAGLAHEDAATRDEDAPRSLGGSAAQACLGDSGGRAA